MDQALQTHTALPIHSLEESLRLGQSLHLEFEGFPSLNGGYHLWGICPNQSIMVSAPQLEVSDALLDLSVKARLFIEQLDSACAFRTTISHICPTPSPYLHIAMPNSIVSGEMRRNTRANIRIPCVLNYSDGRDISSINTRLNTIQAKMVDASICGCRIDTTANDLKVGDNIIMNFEIRVFGIVQIIDLTAMIRSRTETASGYSMGAQFLEIKDCHRIALSSYLLKHA